jgi:DNA-binding transcriptional ArsR family regulator
MHAYLALVTSEEPVGASPLQRGARWELYGLLADPVRVRLLALTSAEELSVSELAELLREGQPKVSRHAAALRDAGLVSSRKQGTWVLLRLRPGVDADPVVRDAVRAGRASCERDGTWAMIDRLIAARDTKAREFFARGGRPVAVGPPSEMGAYLVALRMLLPRRHLAIDAGTGDGALLEVLSPLFDRVLAVDRSEPQVELARERADARGLTNVDFVVGEIDSERTYKAARAISAHGADLVFASRVLHHAAQPERAMRALSHLAAAPTADSPGGAVVVLDYLAHEDEALRDAQADLWLGFTEADLTRMAREAGLTRVNVGRIPAAFRGEGPDRHIEWIHLFAERGADEEPFVPTGGAQRGRVARWSVGTEGQRPEGRYEHFSTTEQHHPDKQHKKEARTRGKPRGRPVLTKKR